MTPPFVVVNLGGCLLLLKHADGGAGECVIAFSVLLE